ncbi:MAG: hypothetical protein ABIX01_02050 [Chitinophagaceae bacterium]
MEVHHHPHAGHKKFKEYFLEFLMIFLAVTMGFFAESLREHITENKKEKEYIEGIISDIKKDTATLSYVLKYYDRIIPRMDSGRKYFYKLQHPGALKTIMGIQFSLAGYEDFIYTDATLQQVKSSGGMLLIKNKAAVDSVLRYDSKVKTALINEKVLGDLMIGMQRNMAGLFNLQPILETVGRSISPVEQKQLVDSLNKFMPDFLLTHDPPTLGQFYNDYTYYQNIATLVKLQMTDLKKTATHTIQFLQKSYQLSD